MDAASKSTNISTGVKFGLIAGLVYCLSLFIRYNFVSGNPIMLGVVAFLFYLVVLAILVFCGLTRKKELGGYLELKEAFQTIFIAILIAELIYFIFNFIYLKYVDPGFFDKFKTSMERFIEGSGMSDEQKEKQLEAIEKQLGKQQQSLSLKGLLFSYLVSVAITGVLGFIISLIIKKKKPVFDTAE